LVKIIDVEKYRDKIRVFEDREHAGRLLAEQLSDYKDDSNSIVIAIPAGGVPVAYIIASELGLPLEVAITRKLHIPWNPEAGFGAVTWNDLVEVNEPLVDRLGVSQTQINEVIEDEKRVIKERRKLYGQEEFPDLEDNHPILVDDGLASGFSMLTTVKAVKKYQPRFITVAIPTAPRSSLQLIESQVNEIHCLNIRSGGFFAVASAYEEWYDLTDEEVLEYLGKYGEER
jgi:predicted phosphoribosyltransferase